MPYYDQNESAEKTLKKYLCGDTQKTELAR